MPGAAFRPATAAFGRPRGAAGSRSRAWAARRGRGRRPCRALRGLGQRLVQQQTVQQRCKQLGST
eukprot:15452536-Alexandrium_andersonii.AAC.1